MNVHQLNKQQAPDAAPTDHAAVAWLKAHKGKIAIATVLIVGLVIWHRMESRAEGGEGGAE